MTERIDSEKAKQLKKANEEFLEKAKCAFRNLLNNARDMNELHFALSLSPEFRPYQDPVWNTSHEAEFAFKQYIDFLASGSFPELQPRIMLALYCHLSEASGYWEIAKNMLSIVDGNAITFNHSENLFANISNPGR